MAGRIGVDEAGRGPVIGSMFVAALSVADGASLPEGIRDSKELSAQRRVELAETIRRSEGIEVGICEVSPREIDEMSGRLNRLTASAMGTAIDETRPARSPPITSIVDACDPNAERFGGWVAESATADIDVVAEHRADERFPIVSAASIIAKESRERHVSELSKRFGEIGSGYPSDPTTRTFLSSYISEVDDLPPIARRTWKTSRELLDASRQDTLSNF